MTEWLRQPRRALTALTAALHRNLLRLHRSSNRLDLVHGAMLSCSAEQTVPHTDPCWAPNPLNRLHSGNDAAANAMARRYPVMCLAAQRLEFG
jgi:hypothetical protein